MSALLMPTRVVGVKRSFVCLCVILCVSVRTMKLIQDVCITIDGYLQNVLLNEDNFCKSE